MASLVDVASGDRAAGHRPGQALRHRHWGRPPAGCGARAGAGRRRGPVVLTDVLDELGTQVAKEIGDSARYVHLDVTSESEWASAVQAAISTFGLVRVLVNNAGMLGTKNAKHHGSNAPRRTRWNYPCRVDPAGQ